ncbi:MAG: preprotein translocase subunit SecG [Candidatus Sungbacteria bacterium]|nr:preprotein translocase subunit SecG [Candidatus Sungbacteria bacterium]
MLLSINIAQVIISVLLVITILLQQRGGGLSPVFGGEGGVYRTRRGVERMIFAATIVLSILFLATAILNILIR